ncbi:aromatic ring-hydroxylating oxygenase subunit alpha [Roseisolibacter agri]|uniref:Choline monooxygenase n=1 Tax=Roseisolibacter agri TaxID=2014610 RepID=A0AA37QB79_9BACT|nr:SRPBCC family protein [Roseisolibacter agri]GLC27107.1 choline monooxygenase [Roseisolibacter agri]
MPIVFPFDPDIARASTIPARLYNDPVYLELERERVFAHTWQLVGRASDVATTGQYLTAEVGNDSIVVVRDGATLRGYHNVCLHRAGPVAQGCGKRQTLQCRYHGWTYGLDGRLLRAPEMEGTANFRADEMRLVPVQVAQWGPLVFANLDGKAPPLLEVLEDVPARVAPFRCETMRWVTRKSWDLACNWKVYVDNYLEGYHLPVVHPGLHKELDYDNYRVEPHRYYSVQHAPLRAVHGGNAAERRYDPARTDVPEAVYVWLFPNTMLNVYLGQMQTNVVLPLSHDRCRVVFDWYAAEPPADHTTDAEWTKLMAFSDEIQDEDIEICEAVQRNLRSRIYDRGRYSAARETGVHHFHSLLHEFLT